MKTSGGLAERARGFAQKAWAATTLLAIAGTLATFSVQPRIATRLSAHPEGLVFPALALAGLVLARWLTGKCADVRAFLAP
jgi:cytochrome bd-type quinol oxidase subunit 2